MFRRATTGLLLLSLHVCSAHADTPTDNMPQSADAEAPTFEQHCRRVFAWALHGKTVEFSSSGLQPATSSYALLDRIVEIATDCASAKISVIGHTDATGNEAANLRLSKDRANAVIALLVARGLSPDRLAAHGVGSSRPLASNDNPYGRRANRRIEFELILE